MSDVFGPIALPPPLLPELALSRSAHDRMADMRSRPGILDEVLGAAGNRVLVVRGGAVPIAPTDVEAGSSGDGERLILLPTPAPGQLWPPSAPDSPLALLLGAVDGGVVVALVLREDDPLPPQLPVDARWAGLRDVGSSLSDADVGLAVEAIALANWHFAHPRCPRCGAPTVPVTGGHERRCTVDESVHHPRSDPAVIMLVLDPEDRVLLGRQAVWPAGRYSVLAGFVEPGESLEAAVRRETREEAGVTVGPVRYLGSQPWPFPASIMLAFEAHATTTDLAVDGVEIAEAAWYSRADLAAAVASRDVVLPPRLSIARQMLQRWAGSDLGADASWR